MPLTHAERQKRYRDAHESDPVAKNRLAAHKPVRTTLDDIQKDKDGASIGRGWVLLNSCNKQQSEVMDSETFTQWPGECETNKRKPSPSHPRQRVAFSTYKNAHTLKTMISITPRGQVSYISANYGGSASDRQIIERSTTSVSIQSSFWLLSAKTYNTS